MVDLANLVRTFRQGVLATVDGDGHPYTAMVAFAPEPDYAAFLVHLSDMSAHKQHIRADSRVSLLVFQPDNARTEILQHHRLSLRCSASIVEKDMTDYAQARRTYLERFPLHRMMFDLGDFDLVRLTPRLGLLNAGFGRAFAVTPADLNTAAHTATDDPIAKL